MSLRDRVAVVTGGGGGIPFAMATALGLAGSRVWLAEINEELGRKAETLLREKGIKADFDKTDVTDEQAVENLFHKVIKSDGRIDILFNGVGGSINQKLVLDLSREEWDRGIALNLTSVFICSKVAARYMIKSRYGRIISVTSDRGRGAPSIVDYACSKAGVDTFTRTFAAELLRLNVDVTINAINPSGTDSPSFRRGRSHEEIERIRASGRLANPEDMGNLVVFLASHYSSVISGQVIDNKKHGFSLPAERIKEQELRKFL